MANNENLQRLTTEKAREIGKLGGKKSGEAKRAKKTMKEMLNYLLEQEIQNKKGEKATTLEALMVAQIKEAMKGNTKAVQFIRDTIGENPAQKLDITSKDINIMVADEQHKKMLEEL